MSSPRPKVSVIIPCYNQGHFLDETVKTVLDQTLQDFEIIIVNDASTDPKTIEILKNFKAPKTTFINRTVNGGQGVARNTGIKAAKGQYILPLDADDKIAPQYLEEAAAVLDKKPEVGIVYCLAEYFGEKTGPLGLPAFNLETFLFHNCIQNSAMFRRETWEKTGGYSENIRDWSDYDFWLSIIQEGYIPYRIEKVYWYYRHHAKSLTQTRGWAAFGPEMVKNQAAIMRNHPKLYMQNAEAIVRRAYQNPYVATATEPLSMSNTSPSQNSQPADACCTKEKGKFQCPCVSFTKWLWNKITGKKEACSCSVEKK